MASATGSDGGTGTVRVTASSTGGGGVSGTDAYDSGVAGGNGGNATAVATGSSPNSAYVNAVAAATDGAGAQPTEGSSNNGLGGFASAVVHANALTVEQDSPAFGLQGGTAYVSISANDLSVGSGNTNNGTLSFSGSGSAFTADISGTVNTIASGAVTITTTYVDQCSLTISNGEMCKSPSRATTPVVR